MPTRVDLCMWAFWHDAVINIASFHFLCAAAYMSTHTDSYTSSHSWLVIFLGKIPSCGIAGVKGMYILTFCHILAKMPSKMFEQMCLPASTALSFLDPSLMESHFHSSLSLFNLWNGREDSRSQLTFIKHILTAMLCTDPVCRSCWPLKSHSNPRRKDLMSLVYFSFPCFWGSEG